MEKFFDTNKRYLRLREKLAIGLQLELLDVVADAIEFGIETAKEILIGKEKK